MEVFAQLAWSLILLVIKWVRWPPLFSDVWQGKDLQGALLYVWQGKDLQGRLLASTSLGTDVWQGKELRNG